MRRPAAAQVPQGPDPAPARLTGATAKAAPQPDIASLETELSESLGTRVTIAHGRGGKGKLIIQYTDLDTLDGVLERLRNRS